RRSGTICFVKLGLRLQLLLLLGGLLVLTFLPLYFAVATYTRVTLYDVRLRQAEALGRTVARLVAEARTHRPTEELRALLESHLGGSELEALALYDASGRVVARVGSPELTAHLERRLEPTATDSETIQTARGLALRVVLRDPRGA